ncbi:histidinol-phosphatase HisJ [Bacillus marinisedimentorum]|uniref:histidinol-phosphatase HisJ n=1 Tax=Bacillus marinisedimentorum TaxID=1821260 RepID=UPI0007E07026|nr:histidinol-phosphatase HisJ [Bacillus marinisedimentorum]
MKADGHIHTPFCPHGSSDSLELYVERAAALGFQEMTFTEHAPLPESFLDPAPTRDSSMSRADLDRYFTGIRKVKDKYRKDIRVNAGLEVDFIRGYEKETADFLNDIGHELDDSILSVHFIYAGGEWVCMDYSANEFNRLTDKAGSVENVYRLYYETVHASVLSDLGPYKPKRIGHMTLARKFQKKFPVHQDFKPEILSILNDIKRLGLELDYNGAGTVKPGCLEPYPPGWAAAEADRLGIPLIYGSDAHAADGLGQGISALEPDVRFSLPSGSRRRYHL